MKFVSEEKKLSHISILKSIKLAEGVVPLAVGMYEKPGKVVICERNDNVFLYTDGLGPCIAALLFCRLKSGKSIIGVAHIFRDSFTDGKIATVMEGREKEVIAAKQFRSYKLLKIIELIKESHEYKDEQIDIFLAGGRGDIFDIIHQKLICEYIKTQDKVTLRECLFNPFGLNFKINRNLDLITFPGKFSLTAGIYSNGQTIACKTYDIYFDMNISKFPNRKSLEDYFEKNKFIIYDKYPDPEKNLYCFENLTYGKYCKAKTAFFYQFRGYDYDAGYYRIDSKSPYFQQNKNEHDNSQEYTILLKSFFCGLFANSKKVMDGENIKLISEYTVTLKT